MWTAKGVGVQRLVWLVAAFVWGLAAPICSAEVVVNLYQQGELVAGQGTKERKQAAASALATVLVRVSGQERVLTSEAVIKALDKPEKLLQAFRYESSDQLMTLNDQQVPASNLVMNFSRPGIESLLRQAHLPLWPSNRPSVLVWLVKDDLSQGRTLVSLQDGGELSEAVLGVAARRGLPLVIPLLDLEDQLSISADDVWRLEQAAIIEASARYQADAILVGRYSQTSSGRWISAWTLMHKQHQQVFDGEQQSQERLLEVGLNDVSEYLAGIYGISTNGRGAGTLLMEVQSVNSFADYVDVLAYLGELEVVRQLNLVAIEGGQVRLSLSMEGDVTSFTDTIELDRRLQPMPQQTGQSVNLPAALAPLGSSDNPLRYRWPG